MTAKKRIFVALVLLIQVGVIWPVYPLVSGLHPMVFGLPFSFFWVIFMLLASFFLVLWYYLAEGDNDDSPSSTTSTS